MGKATQTIRIRRKKGTGTHTCPRCKGTGRVKNVGRGANKR